MPPPYLSPPHDARAHLVGLLLASGEGDETAFAELYRLTSAKLFGIIARTCSDSGMAEDVLVDVYLTVWRRAGAYEPGRASPMTWMATIARNRAIDFLRRLPKVPHVEITEAEQVADEAPLAEARMLAAEEGQQLHLCLDALDAPQASAIRRAFFEGLTYSDLAETMAVPLGTMKSWIRRGLQRLKECLHAAD